MPRIKKVRFIFGLAVSIGLLLTGLAYGPRILFGQDDPPAERTAQAMGELPEDSLATVALDLGKIVAGLNDQAENPDTPQTAAIMRQNRARLVEMIGFDPTTPEGLAQGGFDVARPLTLALLPLDETLKPGGLVATIALTDRQAALALVEKIAGLGGAGMVEVPDHPSYFRIGDFVLKFGEKNLYLIGADNKHVERLADFLERGAATPLKASGDFLAAQKYIGRENVLSVFMSFAGALKGLPVPPGVLENLGGLLVNVSTTGGEAFLQFKENAEIKKYLRPGGKCGEILARMDMPLVAASLSVADPVGLLKCAGRIVEPETGETRAEGVIMALTGLTGDTVAAVLSNAALCVAVYPRTADADPNKQPVTFIGFLKINDEQIVSPVLERIAGRQKGTAIEHGGRKFYRMQTGAGVLDVGLVDSWLVFSTAEAQLKNFLAGKIETPWKPKCGDDAFLNAEIFVTSLLYHLVPPEPEIEAVRGLLPLIFGEQYAQVTVRGTADGIRIFPQMQSQSVLKVSPAGMIGNIGMVGVTAGLLFPAISMQQERARRVACCNNLRQIGVGLIVHAEGHDENFPDKLSEIFPCIKDYNVYVCPARGNRGMMTKPEDIDTMSDYAYVKGRKTSDDPGSIVVYDKRPHGDGLNVLFVDGHVEWMSLDEFRELAKKQGVELELEEDGDDEDWDEDEDEDEGVL